MLTEKKKLTLNQQKDKEKDELIVSMKNEMRELIQQRDQVV